MDIGQSVNATSVNEFEVTKEIQRIKALKNQSKLQEEARLRDLQTKVSMQEKRLRAIESKKKNAEERQKRLTEQSDVTKKEIARFRDKKKKRLRVATKYPNLTRDFLFSKGVTQFKLVDSLGATEAYPFTGSAELITDITSTGETLRANNLRILKDGEILKSQACIFTSKKNSKKKGFKNFVKLLSK